jgi:hypothetical protein
MILPALADEKPTQGTNGATHLLYAVFQRKHLPDRPSPSLVARAPPHERTDRKQRLSGGVFPMPPIAQGKLGQRV